MSTSVKTKDLKAEQAKVLSTITEQYQPQFAADVAAILEADQAVTGTRRTMAERVWTVALVLLPMWGDKALLKARRIASNAMSSALTEADSKRLRQSVFKHLPAIAAEVQDADPDTFGQYIAAGYKVPDPSSGQRGSTPVTAAVHIQKAGEHLNALLEDPDSIAESDRDALATLTKVAARFVGTFDKRAKNLASVK
jgi:hypothetical protein